MASILSYKKLDQPQILALTYTLAFHPAIGHEEEKVFLSFDVSRQQIFGNQVEDHQDAHPVQVRHQRKRHFKPDTTSPCC